MRRLRATAAVLVVVSLVVLASGGPAAAQPPGTPHLPDLVTVPPGNFRVTGVKNTPTAARKLFFSNTIGNQGHGPLELRAVNNASTGVTDAWQEIYTHTGTGGGKIKKLTESHVGTFIFHPAHNHWHMGDFAQYDLRAINPDGTAGPILHSTDKVSFCMIDTDSLFPSIEHFGMGLSHSCGQSARQGLRVGMGDTYSANLPDQFIDITGLPTGTYRLVTTADPNLGEHPDGQLLELDDHNNAASIDLTISGRTVTVVPGSSRTGIDQPPLSAADRQQRAADRAERANQLVCLL